MSTSTRWIGLMLVTVLLVSSAAAEDLPMPGADDMDMSSELWLPTFERSAVPPNSPYAKDRSMLSSSDGAATSGSFDVDSLAGLDSAPTAYDLWDERPARIESTGTWLRRGLWYVEADAVALNRTWNRDDQIYAAEDPNVASRGDYPPFSEFVPLTNRLLTLKGSQPGEDTSVRVTLGRFILRDQRNRDHTAEFTVFGGGDFVQTPDVTSEAAFGLYVAWPRSGGNRSFDQSTWQKVTYSSTYNSFEFNYRVKARMGRDQLIMDPDGGWRRSANKGLSRDYLIGMRILEMRDILNWQAEDIVNAGDDGSYVIRTDNDLFGFQFGAGFDYETSRWSLGLHGKCGAYLNDVLCRSTLQFTADDDSDSDLRMSTDELSWIGQAQAVGKWHLTPNFSLRAGLEVLYITSVALAPHQVTFVTNYNDIATSGDPFYLGCSVGFEGYW